MMNYQVMLDNEIEKIKDRKIKPKLLLHSCCAPCSTYVLDYLSDYFNITIFYYNPNIDTIDEFKKRLNEQIRLLKELNNKNINLIEGKYEIEKFEEITKDLEKEPEGGVRCHKCFQLRLEETAKIAKSKKFEYFTTTLSVSPHKSSEAINKIGENLEEKHDVIYLNADFKKKDGYKKSIEFSNQYNLYRQNYCGCKFSKQNRNEENRQQ